MCLKSAHFNIVILYSDGLFLLLSYDLSFPYVIISVNLKIYLNNGILMENKMSVTMLYINMIYNTEVKYVAMILAVISY